MTETTLKQEVQELINEVGRTHRYSMSKIYNLSNRVFDKNETPQSCASCLIRKVRDLRSWLEKQAMEEPVVESTTRKRNTKSREKKS